MNYSISNILNDLSPDENIYRVFKLDRFFDFIESNELVLTKPSKWDDPFENFLSKATILTNTVKSMSFRLTNHFYGQCWTRKKECDGMWRNYASLDNGVIVKTSVDKLFSYIYNSNNKFAKISYFIGNVDYLSDSQIKDLLSHNDFVNWIADSSNINIASTLLIKREEFSYEEEVRILYSDYEGRGDGGDIIKFKVQPIDLFTEIVFAPNISKYRFMAYKEFLIKKGFEGEIIKRSTLYDPFEIYVQQNP